MEIGIAGFVDSEYWLKNDRHSFEKLFLNFYSKPEFGLPHSKWERSVNDIGVIERDKMIQMRFTRTELATLANNLPVKKLNDELFHPFLKHLFESQIVDFSSRNIIHHSIIGKLPDIQYFKQLVLENQNLIHEKLQLDNLVCLSYTNINSNRQFIGKLVNILGEQHTISLDAQHENMVWRSGTEIATKLFELMESSPLIHVEKLDLVNEDISDEPGTPNGSRVCLFFHHFNKLLSQTSKENAKSIETRMRNSIPQSTLMCASKLKLANILSEDELSLCYDLLDTPQTPNTNRKMKI